MLLGLHEKTPFKKSDWTEGLVKCSRCTSVLRNGSIAYRKDSITVLCSECMDANRLSEFVQETIQPPNPRKERDIQNGETVVYALNMKNSTAPMHKNY